MKTCSSCGRELPAISRFCTQCGQPQTPTSSFGSSTTQASPIGELNLQILYGMVAGLVLSLLFPPWESAPSQQPEFLGFHFVLDPPVPDAIVSRVLITIELVTIAIAGLYCSWLFRKPQ
ncbi:MAG: zinc-ribbon domain-containing protein [Nitrospiraceae bacterium]